MFSAKGIVSECIVAGVRERQLISWVAVFGRHGVDSFPGFFVMAIYGAILIHFTFLHANVLPEGCFTDEDHSPYASRETHAIKLGKWLWGFVHFFRTRRRGPLPPPRLQPLWSQQYGKGKFLQYTFFFLHQVEVAPQLLVKEIFGDVIVLH